MPPFQQAQGRAGRQLLPAVYGGLLLLGGLLLGSEAAAQIPPGFVAISMPYDKAQGIALGVRDKPTG